MEPNIETMSPASGRMVKDDNSQINRADVLDALYNADQHSIFVIPVVYDGTTLSYKLMEQPVLEAPGSIFNIEMDQVEALLTAIKATDGIKKIVDPVTVAGVATEATIEAHFGTAQKTLAVRISALGDNTIITPAPGKAIKLTWIQLDAPEANSTEVLAIVKLANGADSERYRINLVAGKGWAHRQKIQGEANAPLLIELSAAKNVDVSYTFEEVTP